MYPLLKKSYSPLLLSLSLIGTACLPVSDKSETNVVNGELSSDFETTVSLTIEKDKVIEYCSGIFVQSNLLLTSGLCLEGAKTVTVTNDSGVFKNKPVSSKTFKIHGKFTSKLAEKTVDGKTSTYPYVPNENIFSDVGLVIFPKDTAPASMIAKIAKSDPQVGDSVWLAGFGAENSAGEGRGKRRVGKNKIAAISNDDYMVISIKNRKDSNGALMGAGDAGGPLYNEKKEIIGITSTKSNNTSTGYYANVRSSLSFKFVEEAMGVVSSSSANSSAFSLSKACEDGEKTVIKFKDAGSSKTLSVNSCTKVTASCTDGKLLNLKASNSSASTLISSAANCEKLREEIGRRAD